MTTHEEYIENGWIENKHFNEPYGWMNNEQYILNENRRIDGFVDGFKKNIFDMLVTFKQDLGGLVEWWWSIDRFVDTLTMPIWKFVWNKIKSRW